MLSAPPYAEKVERIFVIGGASAFAEALSGKTGVACDSIYLTKVYKEFECDVHIPLVDDTQYALVSWQPRTTENGVEFQICKYQSRAAHPGLLPSARPTGVVPPRHEEYQYLDAIRDIITTGVSRGDRTGVGTLSKFGLTSRWSLRDDTFPLLTTKRVFWRGVAEELLWFMSGDTSAATLQAKNIHIWDGNGSREFLDKSGLGHREVGDLGPVYGFQWRHFGAAYKDMHADYR